MLLCTRSARADTRLGLDLDYAPAISTSGVHDGAGFAVHLGAQAHLPMLVAGPEFVFTYDGFGGDLEPKVYRGLAGFRLGVGEIIRPAVFAHLGIGFLHLESTRSAFSYDAGLALDFTAIPLIDLGVHAGYNQVVGDNRHSPLQWLTLGAHAVLVF